MLVSMHPFDNMQDRKNIWEKAWEINNTNWCNMLINVFGGHHGHPTSLQVILGC
jgi:hypothetical protein